MRWWKLRCSSPSVPRCDRPHHPHRKDRFDVLGPSVPLSACTFTRTFERPRWNRPHLHVTEPSLARVKPSWKQLKIEGNNAFKCARYHVSTELYTEALQADGAILPILLLHLAMCLRELDQPTAALGFALAAFAIDSSHFVVWLVISDTLASIAPLGGDIELASAFFRETAARLIANGTTVAVHPYASIAAHYRSVSIALDQNALVRSSTTASSDLGMSAIVQAVIACTSVSNETAAPSSSSSSNRMFTDALKLPANRSERN